MLRKAMIVLLTAVALTGGLTADAFTRSGGEGGGVGHGAGSAVAFIWAAALAEAISPGVAWLSVAALRVCMPKRAATSTAIIFIVAEASGSVAATTTGATSTPITHRTAICMGADVPRRRGKSHEDSRLHRIRRSVRPDDVGRGRLFSMMMRLAGPLGRLEATA